MSLPIVAVYNDSTMVGDVELRRIVAALQRQVSEHFAVAWRGCDAVLATIPNGCPCPPGSWVTRVVDECPVEGASGLHGVAGVPYGLIGVANELRRGRPLSLGLGHEIDELLVNPYDDRVVLWGDGGLVRAEEVIDPVAGEFYEIDGVTVPNFVYPSWFRRDGKGPYDKLGSLSSPGSFGVGGYIGEKAPGLPWSLQYDADAPPSDEALNPHPSSRTGRLLAQEAA